MTFTERLAEVFDRGLAEGLETLDATERELFRIQDFIIDYQMSGLNPYIYNRLPDVVGMRATVNAMQRHGLTELASILDKALALFADYKEPETVETWGETLQRYDPADLLSVLDMRIRALENDGVDRVRNGP